MASSLNKIEKKLNQLLAKKAKEEAKYKDTVEKLTVKYQEESKALKDTYDEKVRSLKEENRKKMDELSPEIDFYTKQKQSIERLEAQLRNIELATDERMNNNAKKSDNDEEDTTVVQTAIDNESIIEDEETIIADDNTENESEDNILELESEEVPEENSASQRGGYQFW